MGIALLLGLTLGCGAAYALLRLEVISWVPYDEWRVERALSRGAARPRRVLIIGDSFLETWPFSGCLHNTLTLLLDDAGVGVKVMATPGGGPIEYLDRLRRALPGFKPQLVLLFYHAGNDLTDVILRPDDTPMPLAKAPPQREFPWGWMTNAGIPDDLVEDARQTAGDPRRYGHQVVNPHLLVTALESSAVFQENVLMDGPRTEQGWRKVRSYLTRMVQLTRAAGARLALVVIPSVGQMGQRHLDFLKRAGFSTDPRMLNATVHQDRLEALARQQGIAYLDLLPLLRAHPRRHELFWRRDDHFSQLGHRVSFARVRLALLDPWLAGQPLPGTADP